MKLLAWWDKAIEGTSIGTLIIFIEECLLYSKENNVSQIDIALNYTVHTAKKLDNSSFWISNIDNEDACINFLRQIKKIKNIYLFKDQDSYQLNKIKFNDTHLHWPITQRLNKSNVYDSTLYVKNLWIKNNEIEKIEFKLRYTNKINKILKKYVNNQLIIAVHLKNIKTINEEISISLANQKVWFEFLKYESDNSNTLFLLIGEDNVSEEITKLPNVIIARNMIETNFCSNVCLLSVCDGFMGMMSSFANYVIFSSIPYLLFKNPEHHQREMFMEIGDENRYIFSTEKQKILRVNETINILKEEFYILKNNILN